MSIMDNFHSELNEFRKKSNLSIFCSLYIIEYPKRLLKLKETIFLFVPDARVFILDLFNMVFDGFK